MNTITEQENKRREIEQEKRKAQAPEASKKEQERLAKEAEARKREAEALARAMAEKERIQRSADESKSRAEDLKTLRKVDKTQTQDERTKVAFQTNARTVSEKNVAVNAMRNSLNPQQSVDLYRRILKDGERVPRGLRGGGNPWRQVKLSDDSRDKGPKTTTINTYSPPGVRDSSLDAFPNYAIVMWAGDEGGVMTAPTGWAVCDGYSNSIANGGTGIDLKGRFIVGVGADGETGHQDYAVGDTGGYQYHGGGDTDPDSDNNHYKHDLSHDHDVNISISLTTIAHEPAAPSDQMVADYLFDNSGDADGSCNCITSEANWNGNSVTNGSTIKAPSAAGVISHTQTDNRPPFYALYYIQKLAL